MAVLVGSFLTIVVSGLYFVEDVPLMKQIHLQQIDNFNYSRNDLSISDNLAGVTTRLIYYQDLSYPQWTYDNLVFPALRSVEAIDATQNDSSLMIQIPAIRPTLDCLMVSPEELSYQRLISFDGYGGVDTSIAFRSEYTAKLDMPCLINDTTIDCDYRVEFDTYLPIEATEVVTGTATTGPGFPCGATRRGLNLTDDDQEYPLAEGCPGFLYALGTTSTKLFNDTSFTQNNPEVYGYVCREYLEEVQTKVTFNLSDLSISTRFPPVPLNGTARKLNFTYGDYTGPVYRNSLKTLTDVLPKTNSTLGSFLDAIVEGKDGIDVNTLLGQEGAPKLMKAAQELYATYMVQAIDANFRVPQDDLSPGLPARETVYEGTSIQPHRQRLKQEPNTKWALQAMLLFMALCALVVFAFSDRKVFLPCCPCSIAGTMALLAGSEIVSRRIVPEGSEWNARSDIWDGWLFSLG